MKILEIRAMKGPNYWSITQDKLIVMKLDIEELHGHTNRINGFHKRLEEMFSSIVNAENVCLLTKDFFGRVKEGTSVVHVIEYIAIALQKMAGMNTDYGITYTCPQKGTYNIVFSYEEEEAGIFAAEAAVRIAEAIINGVYHNPESDVAKLREMCEEKFSGLSTGAILKEVAKRGIPYTKYKDSFYILGYGVNQKRIMETIASTTDFIGVEMAGNKDGTKDLLKEIFIPVPEGVIISKQEELNAAIKTIGYPIVIKPLDGNQGRGISINITSYEQAMEGFKIAKEISDTVIIEKYIRGFDYRVLVVDYKFVAAVKRLAASITGDGRLTVQQLIDRINNEPRRKKRPGSILTKIELDEITYNILKKNNITLQTVLEQGKTIYVKETANVSTGAIPIDVTDSVHPYNIFQVERIARVVGLDICGIDIMSPDLSVPINENESAVVEVNASPGIRMHMEPAEGVSRDVAGAIVDMLNPGIIPIVAITGTNGDTTAARLIAHIIKTSGIKVGFSTGDGIYINDILLKSGNFPGSQGAEHILKDPSVEFAVLECAREDTFKTGLGFKSCNMGIVLNVTEDHWNIDDINTIEELSQVDAIIPKSVLTDGYAILNADDNLVYAMAEDLNCNIAFFSLQSFSKRIKNHCENGGIAAVLEDGYITVYHGDVKTRIEKIANIPLAFSDQSITMIQNILPAVLCGFLTNFKIKDIRHALRTFMQEQLITPKVEETEMADNIQQE